MHASVAILMLYSPSGTPDPTARQKACEALEVRLRRPAARRCCAMRTCRASQTR
ncbi:MAG: hypothetical protein GF331_01190 [Chitinivibrionales bacterium]|nr:hypothetical protein [Chitinivibrionales bacterium]